jgi:hypothetical protein
MLVDKIERGSRKGYFSEYSEVWWEKPSLKWPKNTDFGPQARKHHEQDLPHPSCFFASYFVANHT